MKKHVLLGICLLVAGVLIVAPGRVQAASMAVLVVGLETDAASDAFAEAIRYEYTQKGYTMVTGAAVLAKQTELRNLHKQNQPVDTTGLAAWGKTNSIDFVQLVVEKGRDLTISGREQLGHVVTCGTTKYAGRSYYRMLFAAQGTVPCECEYECGVIGLNDALASYLMDMVPVVGGVFEMGCKSGRDDKTYSCNSNEQPLHYVRVNSFKIGRYDVTQALWEAVMGDLPADLKNLDSAYLGANKPVVDASFNNIAGAGGFLEKLNAMTGKNYRLPTEAEWEYAARGCNAGVCDSFEYSGSDTVGNVAWYYIRSAGPQVVGQKSPNGLGLYDMSGNVWNWCSDWYSATSYPTGTTASDPQDNPTGPASGSIHVRRGGSWYDNAGLSRVVIRVTSTASVRDFDVGIRLV